jgi:taurine transport system ATP-binding protein
VSGWYVLPRQPLQAGFVYGGHGITGMASGAWEQQERGRMSALSIDKISMRFDLANGTSVQALKDVTLNLEAGELMSVLGPSGCGKTTLLNIVAGFLAPTDGQIILNGQVVRGPGAERGMVFQQGALFEWMSVRENVGFGPTMKGMAAPQKAEIVNHLLDVVGLQDFKDKAVYELSGGMQQRVALARCLANDPDVILMDEPLGALDALTREKMQSLVLKLWKETGKTIILITHSVEEALLLGERLIVMAPRPGRIHKEYRLPFAEMGVGADLREVKKHPDYASTREEILNMIWNMEEEIMGRTEDTP